MPITDDVPPRPKAKPELWTGLKVLGRQMRDTPTPAEDALWQRIRGRQFGVKFRREHAIDRFIVDFYCLEATLVVEVDGGLCHRMDTVRIVASLPEAFEQRGMR